MVPQTRDCREEAETNNPLDTSKWTIRTLFGNDGRRAQGSDSTFSAAREIDFSSDELQLTSHYARSWRKPIIAELRNNDYAVIGRSDQTG